MSEQEETLKNESQLPEGVNAEIKITQLVNGELRLTVTGNGPIDLYQAIGLVETAKYDFLRQVSQEQEGVEVTLDELDIELNPEAGFEIGAKLMMPIAAAQTRDKVRADALKQIEAAGSGEK